MPDALAQLDRMTRVLVLSSPGFEYRASLPPNVRYVGPQLVDPPWAAHAVDWRPDGDGPLVLVAMSSVYQQQAELLAGVATALGWLGVRGVVTTGRAVDPEEVPAPPGVRVVRAAPHGEVMREAAAVVTHCGHGTTLKALAAGAPLVCIPMGRDQHMNAARVLRQGAGVLVGRRAGTGEIASAVRRVLSDPSYADSARRVADLLAREAATLPSAADEVKAALASRQVR